ncbi:MAG: 2-C-methyl-D-erythritol 2,4-cyclodiphosphate synthase [Acidobacteria bacterium]|nr:2-C-methyl-D-erythritol 2,4-cyclodiphosphate synthase [Acidobacteriota bacterium]
MDFRIGIGKDIHRLVAGRRLMIGGVEIDSDLGAKGHSDADVLLHAITDAMLGALALGDIGSHFPNSDERWRNAESSVFLRYALDLAKQRGFRIANIDSTVSLEAPTMRPYIDKIRESIARVLDIDLDRICVKAKTNEKLDAVGRGDAIAAEAIVLLESAEARIPQMPQARSN